MIRRAVCFALLVVAPLGFGTGCLLSASVSNSVSASSESLSDSTTSVSDSASGSSESSSGTDSEATEAARLYREDVRALAHNAAEATRTESFLHDLGRLSEAHGVTHWEARDGAWSAVGSGLAEGGLAPAEVDAFLHAIGRDDAPRHLVMQGFVEAGL